MEENVHAHSIHSSHGLQVGRKFQGNNATVLAIINAKLCHVSSKQQSPEFFQPKSDWVVVFENNTYGFVNGGTVALSPRVNKFFDPLDMRVLYRQRDKDLKGYKILGNVSFEDFCRKVQDLPGGVNDIVCLLGGFTAFALSREEFVKHEENKNLFTYRDFSETLSKRLHLPEYWVEGALESAFGLI